jgi:hypothetical protein
MTNHDHLKNGLSRIRYPDGILACPGSYCAIGGQSFFPGGKGHTGNDLPVGGVMYLGHNFDKIGGFKDSVSRGYEENLTWRSVRSSVLPILEEKRIWFTNYFMGVLTRSSNIGALDQTEGFADYESDCWNFFKLQIALQRPRVIVVLGKEVVRTLSSTNRLGFSGWNLGKSQAFGPLRLIAHKMKLRHSDGVSETQVVAAYHPSYGRSAVQLAAIMADSTFVSSLAEGR